MEAIGHAAGQLILSARVAGSAGDEMQRAERRSAGVVHFQNAAGRVVLDLGNGEGGAEINCIARLKIEDLAAKAGGIVDLQRVSPGVAKKIDRVITNAIWIVGHADLDLAAVGDFDDPQLRRVGLFPRDGLTLDQDAAAIGENQPGVDELGRVPREAGVLIIQRVAAQDLDRVAGVRLDESRVVKIAPRDGNGERRAHRRRTGYPAGVDEVGADVETVVDRGAS